MNNKLRGKDLDKIGYNNNLSKSIALAISSKHFKHTGKDEILNIYKKVKENPADYFADAVLSQLAYSFVEKVKEQNFKVYELKNQTEQFKVYGQNFIEAEAKRQMEIAMSLPVSMQGALMPDAHSGYGLPIGGVLSVENAVIPFGVGVDIGCMMALSIFDYPEKYIKHNEYAFKKALKEFTHFGMEGTMGIKQEHEVLDREEFKSTDLLKNLHAKARRQLGTSGSGNHFVEFGVVQLSENNALGIPEGSYVSLLSHSGSRGLGSNIAMHYTKIAAEICKLPKAAQHLAWLSLDSAEGQEYWMSMNLAGDYAKACHERIHINLSKALGIRPMVNIQNHHNFAWKEKNIDGREIIVHRKGATPAKMGELGIIPGSMINPGYLVSGKGVAESLNSASHGAGRCLSRRKAKDSITVSSFNKMVKNAGVTLIGGSPEESPLAYKNIDEVMSGQEQLVKIEGKFFPKIVRMNKE